MTRKTRQDAQCHGSCNMKYGLFATLHNLESCSVQLRANHLCIHGDWLSCVFRHTADKGTCTGDDAACF